MFRKRPSLMGKLVLLTGASGGIGSLVARRLYLKEGASLILLDIGLPKLSLLKQELEREAIPQATTPAPAQEPFSAEIDYKDEKNIGELAGAFDELRKIIQEELTVSCGERAAKAMLLKTLEKTAFGNFVFKNTNWDSDGKLREDGMIDMERLVRNIKILGPTVRLKTEIEEGMIGLLYMRLKAVKLGLGQEKYEAVKARIINRIHVIEAGYSRDIMGIIKNNIIAPSLKKGDEEI